MRSSSDLHTKARIRNAAIEGFGRDGFGTGIRQIAAAAGVSPGLVVHHFASKAGLREACDAHVLEVMLEAKLATVGAQGPEAMLAQLAHRKEHRHIAEYAVASLSAGGELANNLIAEMTHMTAQFLQAGVEEGTIKASRNPQARAEYLTLSSLGVLLLQYRRHTAVHPGDLEGAFDAVGQISTEPALELFTHGLFTDSRHLRAYLESTTKSEGT